MQHADTDSFHYRIMRMDFLIRLMGTVTSNETTTIS